jgi:hypothetical protein
MKIGKATLRMAAPWGVDPRDPPRTTTKKFNRGLATWTLMMNERDDKPYQKYGYAQHYRLRRKRYARPGQQIAYIHVESKSSL